MTPHCVPEEFIPQGGFKKKQDYAKRQYIICQRGCSARVIKSNQQKSFNAVISTSSYDQKLSTKEQKPRNRAQMVQPH
jgi:hypothetical protein